MSKRLGYLLGGGVSQFRLVDSLKLRTPEFDKRVRKNRQKAKAAKAARKRNRQGH